MDKYIDRQKLEAHFSPAITGKDAYTATEVLLAIQKFPAADVAPVTHAHWIKKDNPNYSPFDGSLPLILICSHCGQEHVVVSKHCPDCGAIMDGKEGEAMGNNEEARPLGTVPEAPEDEFAKLTKAMDELKAAILQETDRVLHFEVTLRKLSKVLNKILKEG